MKIAEIIAVLEQAAPLSYQESYDNAGLLCGSPDDTATGALLCLDSTEEVIDEAISLGCNLVIAHHPIIFSGLKKITGKNYVERVIIKAIRNNISIYAAHTNLDNVHNGVNARICEKLGVLQPRILLSQKGILKKLVTFAPADNAPAIRKALFDAGAGQLGNYDQCSFNTTGMGTFRPLEGADPFTGETGKQHAGEEVKIETIFPAMLENAVLRALKTTHPYEEIAFDIIALANSHELVGSGMIGELASEMEIVKFLEQVKEKMAAGSLRYTAPVNKKVRRIAVCGGSGSFLLAEAIRQKADVFITADFKYHQYFDSDNQIVIADIGHYESEQYTPSVFYDILNKKFSTFALHLSKINTNPIKYL